MSIYLCSHGEFVRTVYTVQAKNARVALKKAKIKSFSNPKDVDFITHSNKWKIKLLRKEVENE